MSPILRPLRGPYKQSQLHGMIKMAVRLRGPSLRPSLHRACSNSHPTAAGTTHFVDKITEALKQSRLAWLSWKLGFPFLAMALILLRSSTALWSSTMPLKERC